MSHVYKQIVLTGTSKNSIEDAVSTALAKAAETVRNLRWFEITETRGHIENQKVSHWQVTMNVGFTLDD
jgi:flavin-binding protein dodecin